VCATIPSAGGWEAIKQIPKRPELLDDDAIAGKAIKCISMLLPKMPAKHHYKVIFMMRPMEEVAKSQRSMIKRLNSSGPVLDEAQLLRGLAAHLDEIRYWMSAAENVEWMEVDYPTLIKNPQSVIHRVVEFLGSECLPTTEKMVSVIDASLHRHK
jgi:sulfotransferase family protein